MKDQKLLNETKCMFEYSLQTYVGTKQKFVNVSQLSFFCFVCVELLDVILIFMHNNIEYWNPNIL